MRTWKIIWIAVAAISMSCGGTMPQGGCTPACQSGFTCQGTTCVPSAGSCTPACQSGFTCQGTTCVVDPTGFWILTVTSGVISEKKQDGSSWDVPGGLPDAMVCLTIQGAAKKCTPSKSDTLMPRWDSSFPAATATALQSGIGVEFLDEDLASNDIICAGNTPVTVASFASKTWGVSCPGTTSGFSATLSPR